MAGLLRRFVCCLLTDEGKKTAGSRHKKAKIMYDTETTPSTQHTIALPILYILKSSGHSQCPLQQTGGKLRNFNSGKSTTILRGHQRPISSTENESNLPSLGKFNVLRTSSKQPDGHTQAIHQHSAKKKQNYSAVRVCRMLDSCRQFTVYKKLKSQASKPQPMLKFRTVTSMDLRRC